MHNNNHTKNTSTRKRTMRVYRDVNIGEDGAEELVIARFFISLDSSAMPELFVIPMIREIVRDENGRDVGLRTRYSGDIEKNAVPLSVTDLMRLYDAAVEAKSDMLRKQTNYQRTRDLEPVPEPRPRLTDELNRLLAKNTEPVIEPEPTPDLKTDWTGMPASLSGALGK